ncbi:MAG: GGDEF domain-containing protein [Rhodoferax sp.]|nr:GGDEF domain-containing protein [Rhodoferax sp.]
MNLAAIPIERALEGKPHPLASLSSVVMAKIATDGRLVYGNTGFLRLLGGSSAALAAKDVRGHFLNPGFAELLGMLGPQAQPVFTGILNITDHLGVGHSLTGTVQRDQHQLTLVAEYDVAGMERLNAQVIELNLELAEVQRGLARANRTLRANEARLAQLAVTDPLTGLANRRHLLDFMAQALERSLRFDSTFSIIMADIDFFKKVNDQYGHDQGDVVIKAVAALLQNMVRSVDLVARFGGEEFVIVVQEAGLQSAVELAQRLRQGMAGLVFEQVSGGVTGSFGVAELAAGDDSDALIKRADEALYQSKRSGRNQVTPSLPQPEESAKEVPARTSLSLVSRLR